MQIKSLYVSSLERCNGSLVVAIGIMQLLKTKYRKVAFFRPIIEESAKKDHKIMTIKNYFSLNIPYADTYAFTLSEVDNRISMNKTHELYEQILIQVRQLEEEYDFILIEGIGKNLLSSSIDFDINLAIAKNLSAPFISVLNGNEKNLKQIVESIAIESKSIQTEGCFHFATFVNRLSSKSMEACKNYFSDTQLHYELYFLPEKKELGAPTVKEVKNALNCKHVFGDQKYLEKTIKRNKIIAMRVEHFIDFIEEKDLIITPYDRSDIIMALLTLYHSKLYPNVAGIVLTGGSKMDKNIEKLLNSFENLALPILSTKEDTYTTSIKIEAIKAKITAKSQNKLAIILGMFTTYVDSKKIEAKLLEKNDDIVTPLMFEFNIFKRAREDKSMIVLPESSDERVLKAAEIVMQGNIVNITLLGDELELKNRSSLLGIDISNATIINPLTSELTETFATKFYELRKHKGMQMEEAKEMMMHNETYFATMMVYLGYVDGMVSGAVHTTANTVRPALQIIKTKASSSVVSSLFFMCFDTKVLVYADCAINQDPSAEALATIAIDSADTAKNFGIEPKIAMLSYSTGTSGSGEDVEKIKIATQLVREKRPELQIEGPIQYDAAIDKNIAKQKLPDSKVAGEATVFIFPDLNTGNNTYKAVRDSSGAIAIGPILQGLNKPINDLSRGCIVEDIVNTIAITSIQASGN
ncbi:phosphate acetyltransferase [bacterium]|nr:phosphate acetyltransferase [bacterium]MBU1958591.1 phosphate acetyltransferase [bacterium]